MVTVSIVIVNYNTKDLISSCLKSIKKYTKGKEIEIIIVDNASSDGSITALKKTAKLNPNITLILNTKNRGFSHANNQGMAKARGSYILLLNSDTLFTEDPIGPLLKIMEAQKEIGIVSCALKNPDGSLQGTGGYFPTLFRVFSWMFFIDDLPFIGSFIRPFHPMRSKYNPRSSYYSKPHQFDWVTGAFLLMRRSVYEKIGGFDSDFFMYTEDVDLCFRASKVGWQALYVPTVSITHYGGASSTKEFPIISEFRGMKLFYRKHYSITHQIILRLILKIGALLRMVLFGILEGSDSAKIYAKAFTIS